MECNIKFRDVQELFVPIAVSGPALKLTDVGNIINMLKIPWLFGPHGCGKPLIRL